MRKVPVLAIVLAAAVAAPAGAGPGATWTRHRAPGLSLELPASWADAGAQRGRILREARRVAKADPALAAMIDNLLGATNGSTALRLLAFDLSRSSLETGFATNLNVLRQQTELSLREWREEAVRGLATTSFVEQPVWWRVVRLRAGKSVRFTYRARFRLGTKTLETAITQYAIVKNGVVHVLTFTTLPRLASAYRPVFERSAHSLVLR